MEDKTFGQRIDLLQLLYLTQYVHLPSTIHEAYKSFNSRFSSNSIYQV